MTANALFAVGCYLASHVYICDMFKSEIKDPCIVIEDDLTDEDVNRLYQVVELLFQWDQDNQIQKNKSKELSNARSDSCRNETIAKSKS